MSRETREEVLRQRVSQVLSEGNRLKKYIEDATCLANKSIDLLKNLKDECFPQYFKEMLKKLDEISYSFINFNDSLEEKKLTNILISDEIMSCLIDNSTNKVEVQSHEGTSSVFSSSVKDISNVKKKDSDLESTYTCSDNNDPESIDISANHDDQEKVPTINLHYSENDVFECIIIHIDNPLCIHVVAKEFSQKYQNILSEITHFYNNNNNLLRIASKNELFNTKHTTFAIYDNIGDVWCRAVIQNYLMDDIEKVELLSLDTGRKFIMEASQIHILDSQFVDYYFLMQLSLNLVKPLQGSQEWSKECLEYLRKLELTTCSVMVVKILNDSLLVHMTQEQVDLSIDLALKKLVEFSEINEEHEVKESSFVKIENTVSEDTQSIVDGIHEHYDDNVGPDIDVKFDSLNFNDEKILCKFYKGPPDTTCFKGDRCKKIHRLFNKDGLTVECVPIKLISTFNYPNPESVVNVVVTSIKSCRTIYVQILSSENTNDDYYPTLQEDFKSLEESMNRPQQIASMKNYEYYPSEGEFVAAKYDKTAKWHRAKVISIGSNSVELIFVDYGIWYEVKLSNIKILNTEYFKIPQLAVECDIVNIVKEYPDKVFEARSFLSNITLNKNLSALVKYIQRANEVIGIVLMDDGFDVASMLHACSFVEICSTDTIVKNEFKNQEIRLIPG